MKSVKQAQTPVVVGSIMWKQNGKICKSMIYNKKEEADYELVRGVPVSHFM